MTGSTSIVITIPKDHTKPTRVEVEGHSGPGCQALTSQLEAALGKAEGQEIKPEFYEPEKEPERLRQ